MYCPASGQELGQLGMSVLLPRPDAGDATQGVPGGTVYRMRVVVPRQRRRGRRAAYVVFEGLTPGVYDTWYVPSIVVNPNSYLTTSVAQGGS